MNREFRNLFDSKESRAKLRATGRKAIMAFLNRQRFDLLTAPVYRYLGGAEHIVPLVYNPARDRVIAFYRFPFDGCYEMTTVNRYGWRTVDFYDYLVTDLAYLAEVRQSTRNGIDYPRLVANLRDIGYVP